MARDDDFLDELLAERGPEVRLAVENGVRLRGLVHSLAAHRRERGISQTDVAAKMGTSQSAITRLETDDGDVRLGTLARYAAAIGFSIEVSLASQLRPVTGSLADLRAPRRKPRVPLG